jgi:hypothetical protein
VCEICNPKMGHLLHSFNPRYAFRDMTDMASTSAHDVLSGAYVTPPRATCLHLGDVLAFNIKLFFRGDMLI